MLSDGFKVEIALGAMPACVAELRAVRRGCGVERGRDWPGAHVVGDPDSRVAMHIFVRQPGGEALGCVLIQPTTHPYLLGGTMAWTLDRPFEADPTVFEFGGLAISTSAKDPDFMRMLLMGGAIGIARARQARAMVGLVTPTIEENLHRANLRFDRLGPVKLLGTSRRDDGTADTLYGVAVRLILEDQDPNLLNYLTDLSDGLLCGSSIGLAH